MKGIRRILDSSLAGTAVIGCLSLFLFLALCGTVFFILRPGASATAPTRLPTVPIPTKILQPTDTATPIRYTATTYILPTNTIPPTRFPTEVEATATLLGTVSPEATSVPIKATPSRSCVPGGRPQMAKVVDVIDGDTIAVMLDGLLVKVKYIGIDAPESVSRLEYLGKEARNRNRELIVGRDVLLYKDVSDRDRFDHLLRYVFVDDKFINYELARDMPARWTSRPTLLVPCFSRRRRRASKPLHWGSGRRTLRSRRKFLPAQT
jgi:endonuclease YncB( thermonuclease family)